MDSRKRVLPPQRLLLGFLTGTVILALARSTMEGQQGRPDKLVIGTTLSLTGTPDSAKEKAGIKTLQSFIQEETGFNNVLHRQKSWSELAEKMSRRQLHIGVLPGYAFAWAQE